LLCHLCCRRIVGAPIGGSGLSSIARPNGTLKPKFDANAFCHAARQPGSVARSPLTEWLGQNASGNHIGLLIFESSAGCREISDNTFDCGSTKLNPAGLGTRGGAVQHGSRSWPVSPETAMNGSYRFSSGFGAQSRRISRAPEGLWLTSRFDWYRPQGPSRKGRSTLSMLSLSKPTVRHPRVRSHAGI